MQRFVLHQQHVLTAVRATARQELPFISNLLSVLRVIGYNALRALRKKSQTNASMRFGLACWLTSFISCKGACSLWCLNHLHTADIFNPPFFVFSM